MLNHIEGNPAFASTLTPATGAAIVFTNAGFPAPLAAGKTWNLTGQPDIPPFRQMTYLLLVDWDATNASIYPSVPTELNQAQQWAPNGPEAFIDALNRDYGYTIIGWLNIRNDTPNPYTPGTAFPAAPFMASLYGGIPNEMLFPSPWLGASPIFMRR